MTLRSAVETWQEEYPIPDTLGLIDDDDWKSLKVYVVAVEPFVKASRLLGGENYPTASSVIPFLDEIATNLNTMEAKLPEGDGKIFIRTLRKNLSDRKRFRDDLFKTKAPFNVLTALDPRFGQGKVSTCVCNSTVLQYVQAGRAVLNNIQF